MNLHIRPFAALTLREFHAIIQARLEVFSVEQRCFYQDLDGRDLLSTHLWITGQDGLMAYARYFPDGHGIHLGRVLTRPPFRKLGLGKEIVRAALSSIGRKTVRIQAQSYLERFYEDLGFSRTGPDFILDDIPHTPMSTSPT